MKNMIIKTSKKRRQRMHDHFFKSIFSNPTLVRELIELFFSPQALAGHDLDKIRIVRDAFNNKRADLVVLIPSRIAPGTALDWLIIIEHKSHHDEGLYQQAFDYQYHLRNSYGKDKGYHPRIIMMVFYHGRKAARWSRSFQEGDMGDLSKNISAQRSAQTEGIMLDFKMIILDTNDAKVCQVLQGSRFISRGAIKLMARIWHIKSYSARELAAIIKEDLVDLLRDFWRKDEIACLGIDYLRWAGNCAMEDLQEVERLLILDGILKPGDKMTLRELYLREIFQEGLEEGRREGRQEEQRQVIFNMLNNNIDISVISKVTGLSEEEIQALFVTSG